MPLSLDPRPKGRGALALAVLLLTGLLVPAATSAAKQPPADTEIQILNVSDWHGQIPPLGSGSSAVGGAAILQAYWEADRAANPNTLALTAGDDFGATPPISNFFDDVPAVIAQRMMGIQFGTFGNHNFDKGIAHLQSQVDLAAAPTDADHPGSPYRYVASNLRNLDANLAGVDPVAYTTIAGVKIALIGIVNEEAPTLVTPGNFSTIQITDGVAAADKFARIARRAGADVVIVLTHKGIRGFDGTGAAFGELIDFANGVDPAKIDLIVGDHTDFQYSGFHNGILVQENKSKGATYSKTSLTIEGGDVTGKAITFVTPLASAVTPAADLQAYINQLNADLQPILGAVIGSATVDVLRSDSCGRPDGRLCESMVGNVVTDAMRLEYGTDFAITNAGGLRAALTCPGAGGAAFCPTNITPPPFPITRGSVIGVLPFGNQVATLSVSGAEVKTFLENGVSAMPGANGRFAQVSGLCFTYDVTAPVGSRVTGVVRQATDGSCTGPAVDLTSAATYTLAINDFMAAGGDGYPNVLARATTRDIMAQDVEDYVVASSPLSPSIQGRIVCTTSGGADCGLIFAP